MDYAVFVANATVHLRTSGHPSYVRLRRCLREKGLDPELAILAQLWPEDWAVEEGLVVAPDHAVYNFQLEWFDHPEGAITMWTRMSDRGGYSGMDEYVRAAFDLLDTPRPSGHA